MAQEERDAAKGEEESEEELPDDEDKEEEQEEEYQKWKLREMQRLKRCACSQPPPACVCVGWGVRRLTTVWPPVSRDKDAAEAFERERAETLRRRALTAEERAREDAELERQGLKVFKKEKEQMGFLQKYHHRGAFYMDDSSVRDPNDVRRRCAACLPAWVAQRAPHTSSLPSPADRRWRLRARTGSTRRSCRA